MAVLIVRRLAGGIVLVFVAATLTFMLLSSAGGDVARNIVGDNATNQQAQAKAAELGLDDPLLTRYAYWLGHAVRGDLGTSWFSGRSVVSAISDTLPITLSFVIVGLVLSAILSVALGSFAAIRGGATDRGIQLMSSLGTAIPSFLVALVLVVVFAVQMRLLPATGFVPLSQSVAGWTDSVMLPAIALAVGATAATTLQLRSSMRDVLQTDYVRTLRSRGISTKSLYFKHALRNSVPPSLTVLSLQFIGLLGGAVIIEKVFGLPGVGSLANSAAVEGDIPVVLGVVVVMVSMIVVVNLLVDIAYGWLNPKARRS